MSFLAELMEKLVAKAADNAAVGRVGKSFMDGAERQGTFTQGKDFAKTPEGLAAQFNWSKPEDVGTREGPGTTLKFPNPDDNTEAAWMFRLKPEYIRQQGSSVNQYPMPGMAPHVKAGLPDGKFYNMDTGPLSAGTGQGTRAYPTLYGNILNDPDAYNIKDMLSGVNSYRNNYAMANAIMRKPDAGKRLMMSPEQFRNQPNIDVAALRMAAPEDQVGKLQTEGGLETLRRLIAATNDPNATDYTRQALEGLPSSLSSSMSQGDLGRYVTTLQRSGAPAVQSVGPKALRRLGVTSDALQGYDVDPAAFRGLEYCDGGLVQAGMGVR